MHTLVLNAIVKHGALAVKRYGSVSGIADDNRVPEIFLGSFIACGLHDDTGLEAHVERYYSVIASEHGIRTSPDLMGLVGGFRADIAVYDQERPVAMIEIKIFADGKQPSSVVADRDKMAKLSELCGVDAYIGVFVTDTVRGLYTKRIEALEAALGQPFDLVGEAQNSKSGSWQWCFAAMRIVVGQSLSAQA